MKIRDSGMPDDKIWASFFDVPFILSEMEINSTIQDLAEIGYGYGTFTIPAALRISGTMYAFDIDQELKSIVEEKLVSKQINSIHLQIRDIIEDTTGLPDRSVDYVIRRIELVSNYFS